MPRVLSGWSYIELLYEFAERVEVSLLADDTVILIGPKQGGAMYENIPRTLASVVRRLERGVDAIYQTMGMLKERM